MTSSGAVAEAEARRLGASRFGRIDGLDTLGVPCIQVLRPGAAPVPGNITVNTGIGWTEASARVAAAMECIERHWAENAELPVVVASTRELERDGCPFLAPAAVPLPVGVAVSDDDAMAWVWGRVLGGDALLVPAHEVLCPFTAPPGALDLPWRSAGLAAGWDAPSAVARAILEVLERDAIALAIVARRARSVELRRPSPRLAALLERAAASGVAVEVKELDGAGVPVYAAVLDDRAREAAMFLVAGFGASPDPVRAMERAVLEAVQTRACVLAGTREDLDADGDLQALGYAESRRRLAWWFDATEAWTSMPSHDAEADADADADADDPVDAVARLVDGVRAHFDAPVVVVELSPPDAAATVVKAIVPGASHVVGDQIRIGTRLLPHLAAQFDCR